MTINLVGSSYKVYLTIIHVVCVCLSVPQSVQNTQMPGPIALKFQALLTGPLVRFGENMVRARVTK